MCWAGLLISRATRGAYIPVLCTAPAPLSIDLSPKRITRHTVPRSCRCQTYSVDSGPGNAKRAPTEAITAFGQVDPLNPDLEAAVRLGGRSKQCLLIRKSGNVAHNELAEGERLRGLSRRYTCVSSRADISRHSGTERWIAHGIFWGTGQASETLRTMRSNSPDTVTQTKRGVPRQKNTRPSGRLPNASIVSTSLPKSFSARDLNVSLQRISTDKTSSLA